MSWFLLNRNLTPLEPYDWKLSRTVLRGERGSNAPDLPGINLPQTKIGCEISFNKYFYKPAPLRSLEENERDIIALDEQSQGFIKSLFELM